MRKWLILLSILLILYPNLSLAQEKNDYDVIIVRNDIPVEYIIAMPYSSMYNVPIIQVSQSSLSDQEYEQLLGYYENGARRALILGGTQNAVSESVAETLHSMGYVVDRKWGDARESTAAAFAIDFWESSREVVLLNGSDTGSFLSGSKVAMELECPILLTETATLSSSTEEAIKNLGTGTVYLINHSLSDTIIEELENMGMEIIIVGEDVDYNDISKDGGIAHWALFFIVGAIVGGVLATIARELKRDRSVPEVPLFVLTEDERKVVNAIEKVNGELQQDKIPDMTNFSRPKVSRIVNDLESKKILLREKYGKTYKVKIAKKFITDD